MCRELLGHNSLQYSAPPTARRAFKVYQGRRREPRRVLGIRHILVFAGEQIARTAENPSNCTKDQKACQKEGRPVKPAPCALRVCAMACAHRAPLRAVCHLSYCVGEYTLLHCTTVPREMPRHEATSGASRLASRQQRSFAGATVGRPSMTELAPFRLSVRSIWYLCAHLDAFRENVQEPEI